MAVSAISYYCTPLRHDIPFLKNRYLRLIKEQFSNEDALKETCARTVGGAFRFGPVNTPKESGLPPSVWIAVGTERDVVPFVRYYLLQHAVGNGSAKGYPYWDNKEAVSINAPVVEGALDLCPVQMSYAQFFFSKAPQPS